MKGTTMAHRIDMALFWEDDDFLTDDDVKAILKHTGVDSLENVTIQQFREVERLAVD